MSLEVLLIFFELMAQCGQLHLQVLVIDRKFLRNHLLMDHFQLGDTFPENYGFRFGTLQFSVATLEHALFLAQLILQRYIIEVAFWHVCRARTRTRRLRVITEG